MKSVLYGELFNDFVLLRWYFNESTCIATGFIVYYLVMCNIYALVCLAITRYIIVCRPEYGKLIYFSPQRLRRKRNMCWFHETVIFQLS